MESLENNYYNLTQNNDSVSSHDDTIAATHCDNKNSTKKSRHEQSFHKTKSKIQHVLGIILHNASQAFDADVLQIVAVGSDKPADARGRGVQEDSIGVNGGHRLHHLVHLINKKETEEIIY